MLRRLFRLLWHPVPAGLALLALLPAVGWNALFAGVALLALNGAVTAWRFIPRRGAYAPAAPPERGSAGDGATWTMFAAFSLVAAATGAFAASGASRRRRTECVVFDRL